MIWRLPDHETGNLIPKELVEDKHIRCVKDFQSKLKLVGDPTLEELRKILIFEIGRSTIASKNISAHRTGLGRRKKARYEENIIADHQAEFRKRCWVNDQVFIL